MRAFRKWLLVSFDIKYSSSTRRFAITVFFSHFARAQLYSFSILFWWYFFLCSFCTLYQLIILIAIPLMSSSHSVSGFSDASCFWTTTNLERDSEFFTIHQNDVMIWCRSLLFFSFSLHADMCLYVMRYAIHIAFTIGKSCLTIFIPGFRRNKLDWPTVISNEYFIRNLVALSKDRKNTDTREQCGEIPHFK